MPRSLANLARSTWQLIYQTLTQWSSDNVSRHAAALAYYTIFSLAPLLIIAIAIAGFVFGQRAAQGQVHSQLEQLVGANAAGFVEQMLKSAYQKRVGTIATIAGLLLLLYGATNVFTALQDSLDTLWNVPPKSRPPLLNFLLARLWSFLMVLAVGALLLLSLILSTAISSLQHLIGGVAPQLMQALNVVVFLALLTALFATLFKYVPDAEVRWRDVLLGAFVTATLFTLGKWALGLYLSRPSTTSIYGAAGSFVVLLIFIYYAAQIIFLGAEFTQVFASRDGHPITPAADALRRDQLFAQSSRTAPAPLHPPSQRLPQPAAQPWQKAPEELRRPQPLRPQPLRREQPK